MTQTRNNLCEVLDQSDQHDFKRGSLTNDSDTILSESIPKVKCIGFRLVGMNPNLCGKVEWSHQKLSLDARNISLPVERIPIWYLYLTYRRQHGASDGSQKPRRSRLQNESLPHTGRILQRHDLNSSPLSSRLVPHGVVFKTSVPISTH